MTGSWNFIFSCLFSFIAFHLWFLHLDCSHKWLVSVISPPPPPSFLKKPRENVTLRLWIIFSCLQVSDSSQSYFLSNEKSQLHGSLRQKRPDYLSFQGNFSGSLAGACPCYFKITLAVIKLTAGQKEQKRKWRSRICQKQGDICFLGKDFWSCKGKNRLSGKSGGWELMQDSSVAGEGRGVSWGLGGISSVCHTEASSSPSPCSVLFCFILIHILVLNSMSISRRNLKHEIKLYFSSMNLNSQISMH